jgi:hypothetical protein
MRDEQMVRYSATIRRQKMADLQRRASARQLQTQLDNSARGWHQSRTVFEPAEP